VTNAENTVYSIKRFIGRRWNDTEAHARVPISVLKAETIRLISKFEDATTPSRNIRHDPAKLKQDAENFWVKP
jgi:molecular chaperone DnaK